MEENPTFSTHNCIVYAVYCLMAPLSDLGITNDWSSRSCLAHDISDRFAPFDNVENDVLIASIFKANYYFVTWLDSKPLLLGGNKTMEHPDLKVQACLHLLDR